VGVVTSLCLSVTGKYAEDTALPLQVFGRFVVCKDRPTMEAVAASGAPVDAITLDGDVMRRKGTLSGGYVNNARSKFNTYKQVSLRLVQQQPTQAAVPCIGADPLDISLDRLLE
jgi:hypothetical protein